MEIAEIEKFNPWWSTGKVKEDWLRQYRRKLFFEVMENAESKQIILIQGLRRVGKTTLMFQVIQDLLDKNSTPKSILYFSFDEIAYDVKDVIDSYQKLVLNDTLDRTKGRTFVFLDEIQKVRDWENKLKVFYDLYPRVKFFISGSASIKLRKRSRESLAGRVHDFTLNPLDFEEFLQLKGIDTNRVKKEMNVWKRTVVPLFYQYIKYGAFPEAVDFTSEEAARRYIKNNVVERIIYKDLPEEFGIKDIELLKSIVYLIGKRPGMLVNFSELSKDLGRDQRTISNYFEYLEFSLLIKHVFNYRGSPLASMRKLKKVYFQTPNIVFAFNENLEAVLPKMLENLVVIESGAQFFYRNGYEVDAVVLKDDRVSLPIEVKAHPTKLKSLRKFMKRFGIRSGLVVDFENEERRKEIRIIPAWKYLLKR